MIPNYGILEDEQKLIESKQFIYKYIHPQIYLDYYMFCATKEQMEQFTLLLHPSMERNELLDKKGGVYNKKINRKTKKRKNSRKIKNR